MHTKVCESTEKRMSRTREVAEFLVVSELRCPIAQNEAYIFMFRPSAETGGRPP